MKFFSLMLLLLNFCNFSFASTPGLEGSAPPCVRPFEAVGGVCHFVPEHHSCDQGDGLTVPASAVSSQVSGAFANNRDKFDAIVNKKTRVLHELIFDRR